MPTDSVTALEAPVPKAPSRLEFQLMELATFPSCVSVAVAVKVIGIASVVTEAPSAGAVIVTTGGVLTAVTVTVMLAVPGADTESVAVAVMV